MLAMQFALNMLMVSLGSHHSLLTVGSWLGKYLGLVSICTDIIRVTVLDNCCLQGYHGNLHTLLVSPWLHWSKGTFPKLIFWQ